jgi:hypothetical protein
MPLSSKALLVQLWTSEPYRPTRDLDLLGQGDGSADRYRKIFTELCSQEVENDGLIFLPDTIRVERIRDEEEYDGVRALLTAHLANARIPLQIDVGFGDVISPGPVELQYPTLLPFPAPTLRAYSKENVGAEKFEAMVKLGMANSRMKDLYDLWVMARQFEFQRPGSSGISAEPSGPQTIADYNGFSETLRLVTRAKHPPDVR